MFLILTVVISLVGYIFSTFPECFDISVAAQNGDLDKVKEIVQSGFDVNRVYGFGSPTRPTRVIELSLNHPKIVKFLIDSKAELSFYHPLDLYRDSVLFNAIKTGNPELVQLLLESKASILESIKWDWENYQQELGRAKLDEDKILVFIKNFEENFNNVAKSEDKSRRVWNVPHKFSFHFEAAAHLDDPAIFELLVKYTPYTDICQFDFTKIMFLAVMANRIDIIEKYLKTGVHCLYGTTAGHGTSFSSPGSSLLIHALKLEKYEILRMLVFADSYTQPNLWLEKLQSFSDETTLSQYSDHLQRFNSLVDEYYEHIRLKSLDFQEVSAAARSGDIDAVKRFVENGGDINAAFKLDNDPGMFDREIFVGKLGMRSGVVSSLTTLLHQSLAHPKLVIFLIRSKADVNNFFRYRIISPLMWAVYKHSIEVCEILIDAGISFFDGPTGTPRAIGAAVEADDFKKVHLLDSRAPNDEMALNQVIFGLQFSMKKMNRDHVIIGDEMTPTNENNEFADYFFSSRHSQNPKFQSYIIDAAITLNRTGTIRAMIELKADVSQSQVEQALNLKLYKIAELMLQASRQPMVLGKLHNNPLSDPLRSEAIRSYEKYLLKNQKPFKFFSDYLEKLPPSESELSDILKNTITLQKDPREILRSIGLIAEFEDV